MELNFTRKIRVSGALCYRSKMQYFPNASPLLSICSNSPVTQALTRRSFDLSLNLLQLELKLKSCRLQVYFNFSLASRIILIKKKRHIWLIRQATGFEFKFRPKRTESDRKFIESVYLHRMWMREFRVWVHLKTGPPDQLNNQPKQQNGKRT